MSTLIVNEIEPATGTNLQINSNLRIPGNSLKVNSIEASSGTSVGFADIITTDITVTGTTSQIMSAPLMTSYRKDIDTDLTLPVGTHLNVNDVITVNNGVTITLDSGAEAILVPTSFFTG
ncbi:MAG: hypothetical protein QGG39_03020 [Candidatus Poribacteria bacterium]|jgi:hypothetical protein|nr:hypothetical protein [Candidatus Poribacteria bacterium]|tara:strand:+ start:830 stop:1189 length:360 start_codon:yes stop_codon:yes gene_type:complete